MRWDGDNTRKGGREGGRHKRGRLDGGCVGVGLGFWMGRVCELNESPIHPIPSHPIHSID